MPTCISVNNVACHFSPLKSQEPVVLKDGQVVKIDLGAHVDGFIAHAAHTVVVGASKVRFATLIYINFQDNKVTGKKADVILGAYYALEAALRQIHPSKEKNSKEVSDVIGNVTKAYGVIPVENMISNQYEKYRITGDKQIIQNPVEDTKKKMEVHKFENYEVYGVDILVTTGDGTLTLFLKAYLFICFQEK